MDDKDIKQAETEIKKSDNKETEKSIRNMLNEDKLKSKSPYNNEFTYIW